MKGCLISNERVFASVVCGSLSYENAPLIGKRFLRDLKEYIQRLNRACPRLDETYVMYIAGHLTGDCYVVPGGKVGIYLVIYIYPCTFVR